MKNINTKKVIFFLAAFFAFVVSKSAFAASIEFSKNTPSILSSEKNFYVDVFIDGEGEDINAFLGEITFPEDLVEIASIYNGLTVATAWVVPPVVSGSSIQFAGIMANGFSGTIDPVTNTRSPGTLFRITFRPLREGSGIVNISKAEVYKNDGLGTKLSTTTDSFIFAISKGGDKMETELPDTNGPEEFSPMIVTHPDVYDGKYFLIFSTTDKETGVAYYEVKEGRRPWVRATSPYLLQDQSLRSRIWVRAFDYAGNYTTVSILGPYIRFMYLILIFLFLLLLFLLDRDERKKKEKKGRV
ncbi:MAG: hypothetical protein R3B64_02345 [Candidatus Paceibacterota bacterium]|nr:hypothetical protein [Candidatus Nomurabacteria bacterium]